MKTNLLLESFLASTSLVQHQIDSYNRFVEQDLQKIIDQQSVIEPSVEGFSLKLGKIRLERPSIIESDSSRRNLLPNEARLRNLTYAAPIFLEFVPVIKDVAKVSSYGEVFIGELPVMIRSNLCYEKTMTKTQLLENGEDPEDPGGYFIVKGTERTLIGLEDLAPNRIITTNKKTGNMVVSQVFSTAPGLPRVRTVVSRNQHGIFAVEFPTLHNGIDLVMITRALGLQSSDLMASTEGSLSFKNDMMLNIEMSPSKDISTSDALKEFGKSSAPGQAPEYQLKRAESQLDTYLLPHLGTEKKDRVEKANYLIQMAKRASLVGNKLAKEDDKDHYANKRVKFAGQLMSELFAYAFRFFVKDVKYQIERSSARGRKLNIPTIISSDTITEKISYAMGTGTWVAGQTGVSQVLDRYNQLSSVSHLRRIKSPLAKKHPHFAAREVHGTQWGKICIAETPEGPEAGLTKYLALMAKVSVGADEDFIKKQINDVSKLDTGDKEDEEKKNEKK